MIRLTNKTPSRCYALATSCVLLGLGLDTWGCAVQAVVSVDDYFSWLPNATAVAWFWRRHERW